MFMLQKFDQTTNMGKNSYCPEQGELCVALFHRDQLWYRVAVEQILLDGKVIVYFVDYGNKSEVDVTRLRRLPDDCANLKRQVYMAFISYD